MLKWFVSLFRRKRGLSIYPPRRRGVLSFYEAPKDDEEDRPSWMRRLMPGSGSSEAADYSPMDVGPEFRPRPVERDEERMEIGEDWIKRFEDKLRTNRKEEEAWNLKM